MQLKMEIYCWNCNKIVKAEEEYSIQAKAYVVKCPYCDITLRF